jgi:large subunit ribosomal protein L10
MARPEKVAVVDEVKDMFSSSSAAVLTEYRGLTVAELEQLRKELMSAGATYKIYKNTLVKRAIDGTSGESIASMLEGPNALAFCNSDQSDISGVTKILKTFSDNNPNLIIKGGMYDGEVVTGEQLLDIAELPSRDVLLAQLASAMAAPLYRMASLLAAIPRNFAYGLKAVIDSRPQAVESGEAVESGDSVESGKAVESGEADDIGVTDAAGTPEEAE